MKDRILKIIESENLTPAKFADKLHISRGSISHILGGRNKPSLDVVSKILSEMDYINPDWLINGTGEMYRGEASIHTPQPLQNDLFSQELNIPDKTDGFAQSVGGESVKSKPKQIQDVENNMLNFPQKLSKKITQIIIYYDDSTFESFVPQFSK